MKYEVGVKMTPPEKTTLQKPSLIRVKIGGPSIIKRLSLLFHFSLMDVAFPSDWKKANINPVHEKDNQ